MLMSRSILELRSFNFLSAELPSLHCDHLLDCAAGGCACSPMAQAAMGSGPWGSIDDVMNVQVSTLPPSSHDFSCIGRCCHNDP
jgi:hypothetical protein